MELCPISKKFPSYSGESLRKKGKNNSCKNKTLSYKIITQNVLKYFFLRNNFEPKLKNF